MHSALTVLVVLFLAHAVAQLQPCSSGCASSPFTDPTKLGCTLGDDLCVCKAGPNFDFAIRDCITQACGFTGDALSVQVDAALQQAQSTCATVSASAGGPTATTTTTTPPATVEPTPTTPPATTETTPVPAPTTTAAPPATTPIPSAVISVTPATSATSTLTTSTTTASSSNTSKTSKMSTGSSSSSGVLASATSKASSTASTDADSSAASSDGLSVAAKAGIGAGAGVALLLSAILACYICLKKRKAKKVKAPPGLNYTPMQISKPLPGSGRQYAHDVEAAKIPALSTHFYDQPIPPAAYSPSALSSNYSPKSTYAPSRPSREDDIEVQGRRYEDMIPRTQPRTMI
ncbi:hypothetical protein BJ170DRAFT_600296 [Xylariales sp. AK1849]|nr:hypothetical protein BJ170DRAFT_600296 [Xylariales sp. AK1849]